MNKIKCPVCKNTEQDVHQGHVYCTVCGTVLQATSEYAAGRVRIVLPFGKIN